MWCIISNCHLFYLNNKFCKLYNPTEHFAAGKVTALYKGRVVFRQYIPKKHKRFVSKFTNFVTLWATLMSVYLGKQRQHATALTTAMHRRVLQVIQRVEGLGHKIFMDNYFTPPALFGDVFQQKINACGTVCHDKRGMP